MSTFHARPETAERNWVVIDAQEQILGRLSSRIATILRGKNKPQFTTHVDTGDFVVVINAEKVQVTGNKWEDKTYFRHSGFPGAEKITPLRKLSAKHPERVIYLAVKGMMPKTRLGRKQLRKLKVYAGAEHPHAAQQPAAI
ncbi:MAG: 50S ribosomal protein L13 [Calditrichaeota bacterium]|nr:50S ribosomal protein L13 [Calditrichota bacterium]MCB9366386.1 50S ribosomal protein L13 [Calditrichota bacterium]MCB9391984.1 50S ribosomal protein L13 [Calditrichota bacterium]